MGAEALEKVSLYWLCHLPEAGALQIRRIGELAGSFREAYYIEGTQLWKKGIFKKEENAYRFDNWKKEFSRLEEEYYRLSEKGIRFITPLDADYPKRLYSVYDYPMGLYIKGELPAEDRIRTEDDKGIILLLDDRFQNRQYQQLFPREWKEYEVCGRKEIKEKMEEFWENR